ncbi:cation:proton antiporter [Lactobacillus sp. DCY120]|uniref:Cation:proton antiporter n=1 Tax=Bombilactobacillus apium TaxID=2675299 RepID=A0A850R9K9_9LACO|nr:cation:proton antiporter [Bombilactobacillus apium]NVY96076.1 cation:proton antiporter [Bombilactobacillus apium]
MVTLGILIIILLGTTIGGQLSVRLGIPTVIGQLLMGIILGPAGFGWLQQSNLIHNLADLGVIILIFLAGIASNLQLLRQYWRPSVVVASLGMFFPVVVVYLLGACFHMPPLECLFLGVVFAATSVSISVAVLKELKQLTTPSGTTILGAAVVDDLLAIILLSFLVSLLGDAGKRPLAVTILLQIGYLIFAGLLLKWLAPHLTRIWQHLQLPLPATGGAVILCFTLAYLAEFVGLSNVLGAFIAGLICAQTEFHSAIEHDLEALGESFLIPIFFVSIGLNLDLNSLTRDWWFICILTLAAIGTKLIGAGGGAYLLHFSPAEAYEIGAGMVSRGEMALIITQIGYQAKLFSGEYYTATISAIILTTLAAPFLLQDAVSRLPQATRS